MHKRKFFLRRLRTIQKRNNNFLQLLSQFNWLFTLIYRLRPDLCAFYPQNKIEKIKFILWLACSNTYKNNILKNDESFQFFLNRPLPGLRLTPLQHLVYNNYFNTKSSYSIPKSKKEFISWFYTRGVKEYNLYNLLSNNEKLLYNILVHN